MKWIDENGRIGGKISVIDIIVIVIVLALVCAVAVKSGGNQEIKKAATDSYTYTVNLKGVRQGTADAFKEKDALYLLENGHVAGEIIGVEVSPAVAVVRDNTGQLSEGIVQKRYDVVLTVHADGQIVNDRYYVNRTDELSVNSAIGFSTKYVEFTGTITEITK